MFSFLPLMGGVYMYMHSQGVSVVELRGVDTEVGLFPPTCNLAKDPGLGSARRGIVV